AGPIVDAICGAIEHELAKNDTRVGRDAPVEEGNALQAFRNDFFDRRLWTLNEMGREGRARDLFEHWRRGVAIQLRSLFLCAAQAEHLAAKVASDPDFSAYRRDPAFAALLR
ncbi:MAG: hypothetical protein ABIP89_01480, partial [Polyangiaceae bacterium]